MKTKKLLAIAIGGMFLQGCGGSSSFSTISTPVAATIAAPGAAASPTTGSNTGSVAQITATPTISGTVATGAALAKANIKLTGVGGDDVCTNLPITADDNGKFSCTLKADAKGPFLIVAIDANGQRSPMVSVVASATVAGQETANVTPLSTAVMAQLTGGNALAYAVDKTALAAVTPDQVTAIVTGVRTQVFDALAASGVKNPENFDPIKTPFVGGDHADADLLLDKVKVSQVNGLPALSSIDSDNAPVALADGKTTPAKVATGTGDVDFAGIKQLSAGLEGCFADPVSTRVISTATFASTDGGNEVVASDKCQALASPGFIWGGYRFGQFMRSRLTDPNLTGAKFNQVDLVKYKPTTDGSTVALLNIGYLDNRGIGNNFFMHVKKLPGEGWKMFGNQLPLEITISPILNKYTQLAADAGKPNTGFANAHPSGYETGLAIVVNRFGPHGQGLAYIQVKGPGLPATGLIMAPSPQATNGFMGILSQDGQAPAAGATAVNGNIYRLQSADVDGNVVAPFSTAPSYARANSVDPKDVPQFSQYTFDVFYTGDTTARYSVVQQTVAPLYPASKAMTLQWHTLTNSSMRYLTPSTQEALSTSNSIPLSWNVNPLAPYVNNVSIYGGAAQNNGYVGYTTGQVDVGKPSSGAIDLPVAQFGSCTQQCSYPSLLDGGGAEQRSMWLRLKQYDGSGLIEIVTYN